MSSFVRQTIWEKVLVLKMITEFLKSHFANVSDVLIDPEVKNSRAIHVYQKIGFRIVDTFIAPWHPVSHYLNALTLQRIDMSCLESDPTE